VCNSNIYFAINNIIMFFFCSVYEQNFVSISQSAFLKAIVFLLVVEIKLTCLGRI
jgi:hypothetical protein